MPILELDKKTLDAANIASLGSNASDYKLKSGGRAPGDSDRVGTAPNGEPLYAAEWYREPTDTELSAYLPKNMPEEGGAGLVACRTAPGCRSQPERIRTHLSAAPTHPCRRGQLFFANVTGPLQACPDLGQNVPFRAIN